VNINKDVACVVVVEVFIIQSKYSLFRQ